MSRRFCADGHEVPEGKSFCAFGDNAVESHEGDAPEHDRLEQTPVDDHLGPPPAAAPADCWNCGQPTQDDPKPTICLSCGKPLTPPRLVLTFPAGEVTLSRNEQVQIGRYRELPHAHLCAAYDNVSRWHATVGVDDMNGTWIRDDKSTNGTFVNGREILPPKVTHPLHDGDSVRLGADLTAKVRIYPNGDGP